MAVVSGRLQIRDWTDREGNKRRSAEVVAENIYFGESKRRDSGDTADRGESSYRGGQSGSYGRDSYVGDPGSRSSAFSELDDSDGELPF